ncbi:MAG: CHAT domain-containing protein [Elainellaceae cyanobacterium]
MLEAVQQPFPQQLFDCIRQSLSEEAYSQIKQGAVLHPSMFREELRQRGYPGKVASLTAELGRAIQPQTHPEGWGFLHHKLGLAHYDEAKRKRYPRSLWRSAEEAYKEALQTLQPPQFTEQRLEVLQDLITVLLGLQETAAAQQLQREGAALLNRTLSESPSTHRQRRLALKFASFSQLTVDLALQTGNPTDALPLAETSKNTCLRWMLSDAYEDIPQVSYQQMQSLLASNRAVLYWHLSPSALTGFLLLSGSPQPLPIPAPDLPGSTTEDDTVDEANQPPDRFQQLLAWENRLENWNQQYQSYRNSTGKKGNQEQSSHPWRETLPQQLDQLKAILNIDAIEQTLQAHNIQQLILIPHRDLHRFPLHACLNGYTCTYLPSAHFGLKCSLPLTHPQLLVIENPESTPSGNGKAKELAALPFAEIEAELVRQFISHSSPSAPPKSISLGQASRAEVTKALLQPHHIVHFTGHGTYDDSDPAASCLFLSNTDTLDLTDIIELDLSHCQLVCLAACETAVTGNQSITDEYVGLVSAFLKAGVSYVVSTLWRVESAASALLIVKFYEQWQGGQSPAEALNSAQAFLKQASRQTLISEMEALLPRLSGALGIIFEVRLDALRESAVEQPYSHPYFWAAFTLSGL